MTDQLISFKTAKLAKEKGFTLHTVGSHQYNYYYDENTWRYGFIGSIGAGHIYLDNPAAVPQSLLQKWLREEHKIDLYICRNGEGYSWIIESPKFIDPDFIYGTFEKALEIGLQEALKIL